MTTTLSSDLSLRPDPASALNASTAPDATSDATCNATSHATSNPADNDNTALTTASKPDSSACNIGATCCTDPQSAAQFTPESSSPPDLPVHPMLCLTTVQQQALELLAAGHGDGAVCSRLNVHRTTLYRWKTTHPRFMAELSRRTALYQQSSNAVACRARDAALKIVLNQLRKQPSKSLDIAVRLLCSPQLTRLAAASRPAGLQDIIAQLQSTRPSASTSADDLAGLLTELNTEVTAPEPVHRASKPQAPELEQLNQAIACRKPRPDLQAALIGYSCDPREIDSLTRRPDLLPFDVHYYRFLEEVPASPSLLVSRITTHGPAGITSSLSAAALHRMIQQGLLQRIGSVDLSGGGSSALGEDCLRVWSKHGFPWSFRRADLWRDFVLGWSCESVPQAS